MRNSQYTHQIKYQLRHHDQMSHILAGSAQAQPNDLARIPLNTKILVTVAHRAQQNNINNLTFYIGGPQNNPDLYIALPESVREKDARQFLKAIEEDSILNDNKNGSRRAVLCQALNANTPNTDRGKYKKISFNTQYQLDRRNQEASFLCDVKGTNTIDETLFSSCHMKLDNNNHEATNLEIYSDANRIADLEKQFQEEMLKLQQKNQASQDQLKNEIALLKRENDARQGRITVLSQQLMAEQHKAQQSNDRLQQADLKKRNAEDELRQMQQYIQNQKQRHAAEKSDFENEYSKIEQQLKQAEADFQKSQNEQRKNVKELTKDRNEITRLQNELEDKKRDWEKLIKDYQAESKTQRTEIKTLQQNVQNLTTERDNLALELKKSRQLIGKYQRDVQDLTQLLQKSENERLRLIDELEWAKVQISNLEKELRAAKQKINDLEDELRHKEEESTKLKQINLKLKSRIEELERDAKTKSHDADKITLLKREIEALKQSLLANEGELQLQTESLKQSTQNYESLKAEFNAISLKYNQSVEENKELNNNNLALQDQIQRQKDEFDRLAQQQKEENDKQHLRITSFYKKQIEKINNQYEQKIFTLEQQITSNHSVIEQNSRLITTDSDAKKRAQDEARRYAEENTRLIQELDLLKRSQATEQNDLISQMNRTQQELTNTQLQRDRMQSELEQSLHEITDLNNKIRRGNAKQSELQNEILNLRREQANKNDSSDQKALEDKMEAMNLDRMRLVNEVRTLQDHQSELVQKITTLETKSPVPVANTNNLLVTPEMQSLQQQQSDLLLPLVQSIRELTQAMLLQATNPQNRNKRKAAQDDEYTTEQRVGPDGTIEFVRVPVKKGAAEPKYIPASQPIEITAEMQKVIDADSDIKKLFSISPPSDNAGKDGEALQSDTDHNLKGLENRVMGLKATLSPEKNEIRNEIQQSPASLIALYGAIFKALVPAGKKTTSTIQMSVRPKAQTEKTLPPEIDVNVATLGFNIAVDPHTDVTKYRFTHQTNEDYEQMVAEARQLALSIKQNAVHIMNNNECHFDSPLTINANGKIHRISNGDELAAFQNLCETQKGTWPPEHWEERDGIKHFVHRLTFPILNSAPYPSENFHNKQYSPIEIVPDKLIDMNAHKGVGTANDKRHSSQSSSSSSGDDEVLNISASDDKPLYHKKKKKLSKRERDAKYKNPISPQNSPKSSDDENPISPQNSPKSSDDEEIGNIRPDKRYNRIANHRDDLYESDRENDRTSGTEPTIYQWKNNELGLQPLNSDLNSKPQNTTFTNRENKRRSLDENQENTKRTKL